MAEHYILGDDGHTPVAVDVRTWGNWYQTVGEGRRVALTELPGGIRISTVFLGLDHNWSADGPPILFETMVFGTDDEEMDRYTTWEEAEAGHAELVAKYRERAREAEQREREAAGLPPFE